MTGVVSEISELDPEEPTGTRTTQVRSDGSRESRSASPASATQRPGAASPPRAAQGPQAQAAPGASEAATAKTVKEDPRESEARDWIEQHPSHQKQRLFEVIKGWMLVDPNVTVPETRVEVYSEPPRFLARDPQSLTSGKSAKTAIEYIRRIPSLASEFEAKALGYMATLEIRLITDESLDRAERASLRAQMQKMEAGGPPFFERWVAQTRISQQGQFDRIITGWKNSKLGHHEKCDALHARQLLSCRQYVQAMPDSVQAYLGVELFRAGTQALVDVYAAVAPPFSPASVNSRAKAVGCGMRLKAVE